MTCVKTTASGELIVELYSGKQLLVPELCELDVNWRFFNVLVRMIKKTLAEIPQTLSWAAIADRLPHSKQGGVCQWQDITVILLVAPFLTRNNINALCRRLERSAGLRALLGLTRIPSKSRISIYKNHLLGEQFFRLVRVHLLFYLKRQGHLPLDKLIIDGAPLWGRLNPERLAPRSQIPRELIRRAFQALDLTWIDFYDPPRYGRKVPTSTIVIYYLLMYWLGFRSLNTTYRWVGRYPEILADLGAGVHPASVKPFGGFHARFRRFVTKHYGPEAPFQSLDDLIRQVCHDATTTLFFITVLRIDQLQTNNYFFNLFRYHPRVSDPDAMYGYCDTRKTVFLGYRLILLVDRATKMPLFGRVFPANTNEHTGATMVLEEFFQTFSHLAPALLPRSPALFADRGCQRKSFVEWVANRSLRLFISARKDSSSRSFHWRARQRASVEHTFSDLSAFFGLNRLRTITLPYVQTFIEIVLCARVAQALVALEEGQKDLMMAPSYPAFGR